MPTLSDEAKQLIKDAVDVESLLRTLGFRISRTTSTEVRAPCLLHGGDNPTAFSVRLDTKKWCCFTKRCDQDSAGRSDNDLIALVRRVTNRNFIEAVRFLADFSGLQLDPETMFVADTEEHRRRQDMSRYIRTMSRVGRERPAPKVTEEQVKAFVADRDGYFLSQGFSADTMDAFEVGSMVDPQGIPWATVPIRDAHGVLAGMSARRTDGDEEPRYHAEYEFQKGSVLYNMSKAAQTREETVILVEGFKALWAVWEAGFANVVAAMGANLSRDQVLALCTSGFRNCLILFDGDKAGITGSSFVSKKLKDTFNVRTVTLHNELSPDDLSRSELRELIELYLQSF